jgi:2,4-dienoyl-CoA reductase-like NADH-dependent reductase (Old Yellow Enzyme family)
MKLFAPFSLNGCELKNRIVKSATLENMATLEGLPTDGPQHFYERLARGGAGLIITGFAYINEKGKSYPLQNGIHTDKAVAGWRRITDAVHNLGGKIAMQIVHGGRQTKARALGGRRAVAPSAIPNLVYFTIPEPMTEAEILQTIQDFGNAAARVKEAGFDAVQIHGAHGYLISAFLSPLMNRREDRWGGVFENRFRFIAEVYGAVRKAVGTVYPVLYKMNVNDFMPFSTTERDSFPAAVRLAGLGLDALEISGGIYETGLSVVRGKSFADTMARGHGMLLKYYYKTVLGIEEMVFPFHEAYFLPYAERLKPLLNIPLMLVGGIRSPDIAENILSSGAAEFVSMARPLIREPDLPKRWLQGDNQPAQCVSCNRCFGELDHGNKLRCYFRKD